MTDMKTTKNKLTNKKYSPTMRKIKVTRFEGGSNSFKKEETMPINSCQYFYKCDSCKYILKPKIGDCCVFCSFGSVKCPPIQKGNCC